MSFGCKGKFQHKSLKAAKRSIRKKERHISPYFCTECHYYHIGSSIK